MTKSPTIEAVQQGFTMLELLIVIAIVGIVLGVSAANFVPMIDRTNTREAASLLKANVDYARGEAIVRGGWVAICGSADGKSCQDSYDDGWVVFQDLDRDQKLGKADTILNMTKQENASLNIEIDELTTDGTGPVFFNFKGLPSRAIRFTTKIGDSESGIELAANGVIGTK